MPRIILVGDIHMRDTAPANAADTYPQDILDALTHIAELEEELSADAVVWAGDVFHFPQPGRTSHACVLKMIKVVQKYNNLFIVTGNHDISNHRLESLHEKQPLGVLFASGAKELVGWANEKLPLYGVPWQQRWNDPEQWTEAFDKFKKHPLAKKALVVTHAPIFPPKEAEGVPYELVPTAALAEAMGGTGYLHYGHIHEDHGIFEDGGVTFANVGAISRGSIAEYNIHRDIKVLLWTMDDTEYDDGFHEILIPARPAEEALKIVEATEEKRARVSLDEFLSEIGYREISITDTGSVADHIRTMELKPSVKTLALGILSEVET